MSTPRVPSDDDAGDDLGVDVWLPLPDVADRLGTDVGRVRRMVQERRLIAARAGARRIICVPERCLVETDDGWVPVPALQGTLVLLADAGYSDVEALRWLFAPDPTLPTRDGTAIAPIDSLRAGQRGEVRRRAQALAF